MNQDLQPSDEHRVDMGKLTRMVTGRFLGVAIFLGLMFFLPAGTFLYWEAWVYLAILLTPMLLVVIYLLKNDPELLERRMRTREKHPTQKVVILSSVVVMLAIFILPGFDKRYGWSSVPTSVVIVADLLVLLGYGLFALVLRENPYASRVVEVEKDQKIITTGPYAVVRHPMYVGIGILYILTPLALGSFWGMIPSALLPLFFIARILNEEKVLLKELEGYKEYTQRVKYRLLPGIW